MAVKRCLVNVDVARVRNLTKKSPPVNIDKQKMAEKQSMLFVAAKNDLGFEASIASLNESKTVGAYQEKLAGNGIKTTRVAIKKLIKDYDKGILKPLPKPISKSASIPISKPTPKPVLKPKPIPPSVPVPKREPAPKWEDSKTLGEAVKIYKGRYGVNNPIEKGFVGTEKQKLDTMNRINAQMSEIERWAKGRWLLNLVFEDGDAKWNGQTESAHQIRGSLIRLSNVKSFDKYGFKENTVGALNKARFSVSGGDLSVTLRHEMGHLLYFDGERTKDFDLRSEFEERFKDTKKTVIQKNLSMYAAKNEKEFFAESFAMYSSPEYKLGTLNKAFGGGFEELLERNLVSGAEGFPYAPLKPMAKVKPKEKTIDSMDV